jgi:hypothetical protein
MEEQTLIDKVEEAMSTDDVGRARQSGILLDTYDEATTQEKAKIDDCFIALCGWSLQTLIAGENM